MALLPDTPNSASRRFMVSSAVWFAVGTFVGLTTSLTFIAPDLTAGISWLEFGRIRPVHVNLVLFGFVGMGLIGGVLYIVPVLLRTKLYAERLANSSMWTWNLAMVGVLISLPLGYSQAREYAELIFPVKCVVLAALIQLTIVGLGTVALRTENVLYVSVWYGVGGLLWTTVLYPLGNVMWHPATGSVGGIVDAIWLWWYGHNVFGLVATPMSLAMAYYLVPRIARRPLYSHQLSLIGFWTILVLYSHIGGHHLLQAPIPVWLKAVSVIGSVAMIVPVVTVLVNLWMTMRGELPRFAETVPHRMIFASTVWYLIVCLQGCMHSLPSVQRYTHFTHWVVGHSHIAVLAFAGMMALGSDWYLLPLICGRKVYSQVLLSTEYWLVLIGVTGFFFVLSIAGLIQGQGWVDGETVYRVLPSIIPYMAARSVFGVMILVGAWMGLYNLIMTMYRGEPMET